MIQEVTINTPEEAVTQYLDFISTHWPMVKGFQRAGRFWTPAKKPTAYPYGKMKMCFQNAARATWDYGLRYVEGYAFQGILATPHAWNEDDDNNVIDLTWRTTGSKKSNLYHDLSDLAYFGIEVPAKELNKILVTTKTYGALFKPGGYSIPEGEVHV